MPRKISRVHVHLLKSSDFKPVVSADGAADSSSEAGRQSPFLTPLEQPKTAKQVQLGDQKQAIYICLLDLTVGTNIDFLKNRNA